MTTLSPDRLRELFHYDSETGLFTRLLTRGGRPRGAVAGSPEQDGYLVIQVDGRRYFSHRLAWLYVNGEWPTEQIDHIDGNKANNRIVNLRNASRSENKQNLRRAQASNLSSQVLGVTRHKSGKWQAQIKLNNKNTYLGLFKSIEQAQAAYLDAKKQIHPYGMLEAYAPRAAA